MHKTREFWDQQAEKHGADQIATAPDHFYRDNVEIKRIVEVMTIMEPEASWMWVAVMVTPRSKSPRSFRHRW